MKRKLLFSIIFALSILPSITYAQSGNVSVNVTEMFRGRIRAFIVHPPTVFPGSEVSFLVEFENLGSVKMDSQISIEVFNASNLRNPLGVFVDITRPLPPGKISVYKVSYMPPGIGIYIVKAKVVFDGTFQVKHGVFWVVLPPPPVKIIEVPTVIPIPAPPPPPVEIFNATLEFKDRYDLVEGVHLIPITFKNTGNMPLTNIRIQITSDVDFDVFPKFLFSLNPGEQVTFVIAANIPLEIRGEKKIFFEITSNELLRSGQISLFIFPKLTLEMLATLIENYEFLISKIGFEIETAKAKGIDVTKAEDYLRRARESLDLAKSFFGKKLIDETKTSLDLTGEFIKRSTIELSMALIPIIPVLPYYINLILLVVIVASATFIAYTLYRKWRKGRIALPT